MPSSTPDGKRKRRHQAHANNSYTSFSAAKATTRLTSTVAPSASYTEGHDTLTYITTHLPPATPSPPSSPGTPLTHSSSSSSLPAVVSEHKDDDMNDAMILSNEAEDEDEEVDEDEEDVDQLLLASSSALPSAPSVSFLIPQYDKAHQPASPTHDSHALSPSPTHSTPLLLRTASASSRTSRQARKVMHFLSSPTVLLVGSCVFLMLLSGVNSLLWVNISTRFGLQHAYLLNQLSTLLFVAFCAAAVLVNSSSLSTLRLSSFLSPPLLLVGFLDALCGIFITLGSPRTPGPFQLLLYQFALLFSFPVFAALQEYGQDDT